MKGKIVEKNDEVIKLLKSINVKLSVIIIVGGGMGYFILYSLIMMGSK